MESIKVVLADDHNLVRAGIKSLIEALPDCKVVNEATNGRELLEKIEDPVPDIILLDLDMKEMNGLEALRRIKKMNPSIKVLILSMHSNEEYVIQALVSGAEGYMIKDSVPSELAIALDAVFRNENYLSPAISKTVIENYLAKISGNNKDLFENEDINEIYNLTERQREILQLIAEGNPTKTIADKLHISPKTVETHRTQLMTKLGLKNIPELIKYAISKGIIV